MHNGMHPGVATQRGVSPREPMAMLLLGSYGAPKIEDLFGKPPIPTRRSYNCETLRRRTTRCAAPCSGKGCPIDPADAPFEASRAAA